MNKQHIIAALVLALFSLNGYAESAQSTYVPSESIVSVGSMLQMIAGLLLVLLLIGAIAWALKRFAIFPQAASGAVKVIASASVGQRERVVIVEVEDARLVLGVTPQQINTLHCLPKNSASDTNLSSIHSSVNEPFSEELGRKLDNKHDG